MLNLKHLDHAALAEAVSGTIQFYLGDYADAIDLDSFAPTLADDVLQMLRWAEAAQAPGDPEGRDKHFSGTHLRVLFLLANSPPATDSQLWRLWSSRMSRRENPWPLSSPAGLRSRRAELVRWGLAEHTGTWGTSDAGRRSREWHPVRTNRRPHALPRFEPSALAALTALEQDAGDDLTLAALLAELTSYAVTA